ncbi:MAG: hypothetical protein CM15mP74_35200 [Halieaceae bacterium]|nr:MAG: hypothetical protein CM15mP74_35200 [Halieaceae bacterium]
MDPATGLTSDGGVPSVLVGDMDGGSSCIDGIPLGGQGGITPDPAFLASVTADPNCFSFIETIPAGFVPRFGGDNEDQAVAVGLRGTIGMGSGLSYDISAQRGSNKTGFFINNTINASLGPDTPATLFLAAKSKLRRFTILTSPTDLKWAWHLSSTLR